MGTHMSPHQSELLFKVLTAISEKKKTKKNYGFSVPSDKEFQYKYKVNVRGRYFLVIG